MRLVRNWLYFMADLCHCALIMVKADAVFFVVFLFSFMSLSRLFHS